MLALTRTSRNNLLNTEKESYSFPKLGNCYFIFILFIGQASLLTWGKSVLCVQVFFWGRDPFSIKAGSYLAEIPSPRTQGSPEQRFSAPGGRDHRSSFSPCRHPGGLGSVKPGIPVLLSRSTPSNRQLISFSFSNRDPILS